MYEFEVDFKAIAINDVPEDIQSSFQKSATEFSCIDAISPLLWEEHCTECAMPSCYKTCEIYEPRKDGKCRRFQHGISKINVKGSFLNYIVKIDFKQWASLMATTSVKMDYLQNSLLMEGRINKVEDFARRFPDNWLSIAGRRGISSRLARRYKKKQIINLPNNEITPSNFIIECYNPSAEVIDFTITIRAEGESKKSFPFQKRLKLNEGFHKEIIPYSEIEQHIDLNENHFISIIPNAPKEPSLYFGFIGFTRNKTAVSTPSPTPILPKKIKIMVWDLDHTLWDGILVEEIETSPLKLKPGIVEIIKELDQRGIVNSIISKNDNHIALQKLKYFGLDEYFVFSEISWEPKSIAMTKIINNFNVNADTIAYIDDSAFEREEVNSQHPTVRIYKDSEYQNILSKDEFNPDVSAESSQRRAFYKSQQTRKSATDTFQGGYFDFIKNCEINLRISKGRLENIDRIHELLQRTNQMNFSGNRYTKSELSDILNSTQFHTFQLKCDDKFGDYGTVGFCIFDVTKVQITDLAFSCRVQSKRVEHTFIQWLIERNQDKSQTKIYSTYNKTDKNTQSGKVFNDLEFIQEEENLYYFPLNNTIKPNDLINVIFEED